MSATLLSNPYLEEERTVGSRERIYAVLCENSGTPLNLTDKSIKCQAFLPGETIPTIDAAATIGDAEKGIVYYDPTEEDAAKWMTPGLKIAVYFYIDESPHKLFPYDGPKRVLKIVAKAMPVTESEG